MKYLSLVFLFTAGCASSYDIRQVDGTITQRVWVEPAFQGVTLTFEQPNGKRIRALECSNARATCKEIQ